MRHRIVPVLAALVVLAAGASGCATPSAAEDSRVPAGAASASASAQPTTGDTAGPTTGAARLARPARSQRVRFVPQRVVLPGGAAAEVEPADTVGGVLQVPTDVHEIGWWTGSAYVGDPFGATVLAGHVDSVDQGVGFFARLLQIKKGDRVTVSANGHRATYRVRSVGLVAKQALADDGSALDQTGDHRLVLITCAGRFVPEQGGSQSNLVVIADPVGPAR